MLIITGTGRCGSSLLSKFCSKVGYDTGGSWIDQVDGGKELDQLVAINKNIKEGKKPDLSPINRPVVKDPNFVLFDGVLQYWAERRSDIKFLFLKRDLEKVVASVGRHPQFFSEDDVRHNIDALRQKVANFYNTLWEYRINCQSLRFPDFLEDYDIVYRILTIFGDLDFDYKEGKDIWDNLVDHKKVHV